MKTTFEKQEFNSEFENNSKYIAMFNELGFNPTKVEVCYTNGCSAYVSLNINVLNEGKMWAETFVFEGKALITVRVSDHQSNLERICGGVSGNKMSFNSFKHLVRNNVISCNNN